jgi:hypothetical protein
MGVTRFPNGVSLASEGSTEHYPVGSTTQSVKVGSLAGTVITGGGTIAAAAFGLSTATAAVANLAGTAAFAGTASGNPAYVKTNIAGGSVAIRIYDATGTQATAAGTVAIIAHGT